MVMRPVPQRELGGFVWGDFAGDAQKESTKGGSRQLIGLRFWAD